MARRLVDQPSRTRRSPLRRRRRVVLLGLRAPLLAVALFGLATASFALARRGASSETITEYVGEAGLPPVATTADAPPDTVVRVDPPSWAQAVSGDGLGAIDVSWGPPIVGIPSDGYRVLFEPIGEGTPTEVAMPRDATALRKFGLHPGRYRVSVETVVASVLSDPIVAGDAVAPYPPAAPNALSVIPGDDGSVVVQWKPPLDTGGKAVQWYTVRYAPQGRPAADAVTTSVRGSEGKRREFGLPPGDYSVTVVALTQVGSGPPSTPATVRVLAPAARATPPAGVPGPPAAPATTAPPPSAPRDVVASVGHGGLSIDVAWTPPASGAPKDGYRVSFASVDSIAEFVVPLERDRLRLEQYGMSPGSYDVVVRAVSDAVEGAPGRTAAPVILGAPTSSEKPTPPTAPQSVTAVSGDGLGAIRVDWQPPTSGVPLDGYRVTFRPRSGAPSITTALRPDTLTFNQLNLPPDLYDVSVVAVSASLTGPTGDAPAPVVPTGFPGTPRDLTVSGGIEPGSLVMKWRPPATDGGKAIDWYTLTYQPVGDDDRKAISTSVKGGETTLTEYGLRPGRYDVSISALNQEGRGESSPGVAATVK